MILLIILLAGSAFTIYNVYIQGYKQNHVFFAFFIVFTVGYICCLLMIRFINNYQYKEYVYNVEKYQELKQSNDTNTAKFKKMEDEILDKGIILQDHKIFDELGFDLFIPDEEFKKALKARNKFENIKVQKK